MSLGNHWVFPLISTSINLIISESSLQRPADPISPTYSQQPFRTPGVTAMFRRLSTSLPSDFEYPADLKSLGYHLHKDTDQIHSIEPPHHDFNSFISRNERKNEVLTEAYHGMNTQIEESWL